MKSILGMGRENHFLFKILFFSLNLILIRLIQGQSIALSSFLPQTSTAFKDHAPVISFLLVDPSFLLPHKYELISPLIHC